MIPPYTSVTEPPVKFSKRLCLWWKCGESFIIEDLSFIKYFDRGSLSDKTVWVYDQFEHSGRYKMIQSLYQEDKDDTEPILLSETQNEHILIKFAKFRKKIW